MAKQTLNEHLVTYYERKQLSELTLANLNAIIEESGEGERKRWNRFRLSLPPLRRFLSPGVLAYASVLILLGYIAWMVTDEPGRDGVPVNLSKAIAREIAMNHWKLLDVEFISETIPDLSQQMGKLDFSLIRPGRLSEALTIVGARYCSIQGAIAAQIQLTDAAGHPYTLYQTRIRAPLTSIQEETFEFEGLQLKLWHENGIFLGLAGPEA